MTNAQLEERVFRILDNVRSKRPVEDDLVECKTKWVEQGHKSARHIAASANAARGEDVLWVIGVDESNNTVVGADDTELSNWMSSAASCFENGHAPTLLRVRNVISEGQTVVALLFSTGAPPYVVKNPASGAITLEVPWRRNNQTLTARREDLLRMLVPITLVPECETTGAVVGIGSEGAAPLLSLNLTVYLTPQTAEIVYIPLLHCEASVRLRRTDDFVALSVQRLHQLENGNTRRFPPEAYSTVMEGVRELIVKGPGAAHLTAMTRQVPQVAPGDEVDMLVKMRPARASTPITITETLYRQVKPSGAVGWERR